jgi:type I restriction enzyme S subunit
VTSLTQSRLGELTDPERSITYGVVKPGPEQEDGVLFVRGGDVLGGRIAIDVLRTITPSVSAEYKRTLLRGGELLVSLVGNPGEVAIAPESLAGANIARQVGLVALRSDVNARYVMYYLMSPMGRADLFTQTGGAVQQVINLADLKRVVVPLPSQLVQNRIADILSNYDDLIENNRRRMALLEEAARQLYREWFVRLRFPGHEHTRITNGVPERWEKKRLCEVAEINKESLSGSYDGEIEYIDISSVTPGVINETTRYDFKEAPSRARRVVRHGDIIWSCVRPNRRSYAVIWQPEPNLVASTGFAVLTPTTVPTAFLLQATSTDAFVGYLENHARGAAYPAVVAGDFERAEVLVPTPVLLSMFNEQTEPLIGQANTLRLLNNRLRAARDLLLPRLMAGQITV